MQLQALLWLFLPLFVAAGSALVSYYIMQARMEVALAKERESLAEARAVIQSHKITLEERIKATEEATRRATLDEMMQDIRIEERSYVRDSNAAEGARRSLVLQERVFFRNIPMSNWSERELIIEQAPMNGLSPRPENMEPVVLGAGSTRHLSTSGYETPVPQAVSKPAPAPVAAVPVPPPPPAPKTPTVIEPVTPARRENRTLVAVHAAFGAQ